MKRAASLLVLTASLIFAQSAETGRGVARISLLAGDVSVKRGDSGEWIAAAVNAPLVVEDRLYTASGSRAEIQFDWANMLRLASNAEVHLAELENRRYQVQIARGTITFRVLRDSEADVEISTPSVSIRPLRRGEYRVTVLEDGSSEITVRSGEADIFTPLGSERLKSGKTMMARGTASDPEFQVMTSIPEDDWDRWNERRDRDLERSRSYQYVSRDVYGADDLDGYGEWIRAEPYGHVWAPRVAPGWAPYRYGRWSWIDWYGWTWVSHDPWGWAPYHYGRWFHHGSRWCWYPGPIHVRASWRPALVAFFGFGRVGLGVGLGNVGWVPLAPYEPYYPWYGQRYYSGYRNRGSIDNSVHITNNINIRNVYRNSRVDNGITAVNAGDFSRGRTGRVIRVAHNEIERASLVRGQVPLAPERESRRLADREVRASVLPGSAGSDRQFYSRRQSAPVERVSFEDQRQGVDRIARRTWQPAETAVGTQQGNDRAAAEERSVMGRSNRAGPERTAEDGASRGWRRIGEPSQAEAPRAVEGVGRNRDASTGWRRFGSPGRMESSLNSNDTRLSERRGFGSPEREGESGDLSSVPARSRGSSRPDEGARHEEGGWRRLGAGRSGQNETSGVNRSQRTQLEERSGSRSESLRISPPIVRERESQRSESGPRGSGGGSMRGEPRSGGPTGGIGNGGGRIQRDSGGGARVGGAGGGGRGEGARSQGGSGGRGR